MKKIILTLVAALGLFGSVNAQTWKMVVTKDDGTTDTLTTGKVKSVSFAVDDQNTESIIIKELYNSGCPLDEGTGYFQMDKGFILYNNSPEVAVANNLCVGMISPYNSNATNNWYSSGVLTYTDFIPATMGIWYFQQPVILQPYEQRVVNVNGAIDNTTAYSQSVNYAHSAYYAMYDPESGFNNTKYYPTPSDSIPASHYLKAVKYGQGNAWPLSVSSPGFFIFQTKGTTPAAYATNNDNYIYEPGTAQNAISRCLKVPTSWIVDGMEVYVANNSNNQKRLTSDIDAGYVSLTNRLGHSLYRNVDTEATEALPENSGKLVYNYSMAVDATNNGTGVIDAEASIRNGAHIIYEDTNNSTNDFHERTQFSLRDTK
jgi:hypothetical protein